MGQLANEVRAALEAELEPRAGSWRPRRWRPGSEAERWMSPSPASP